MSDVTTITLGAPPTGPQPQPQGMTTAEASFIHGLVGAPFGDLELDVGKSVRWTQWFCDDIVITDVNLGQPRYWVVNWEKTFPEAFHNVTSINFFVDPAGFRKAQFAYAEAETHIILEDNDWVLFIDAAEGMSCDDSSLPNDYATQPFRSFVYREIQRALDAGRDNVVFPFFAFLRHANIGNVEYLHSAFAGAPLGFSTVQQSIGIPYYQPDLGLPRLWKVSSLRSPGFDWHRLDIPVAIPDTTVKLQLVSYAYAHWNEQDIVPPATTVPPLDATNDDGWQMRKLISMVRPVPGLPYQDPWKPPAQDPAGEPGPWAGDLTGTPDVGVWHDGVFDTTIGRAWAYFNPDNPNYSISRVPWQIWFKGSFTNVTADQWIAGVGLTAAPTDLEWALGLINDALVLRLSDNGTTGTDCVLATLTQLGLVNNTTAYFGIEFHPLVTAGNVFTVQAIHSTDGETWTPVGPVVERPVMNYWASLSRLELPPTVTPMQGKLNTFMMLDADSMTELLRFDVDEWPTGSPPPSTFVGNHGTQWEISNTSALTVGSVTPLSVPAPTANTRGLLVPLYDTVFRINLRDGVWYDAGQLGNVPLIWNDTTQTWDPVVDPVDWQNDAYVQAP